MTEHCAQHAPNEMVKVKSKTCRIESCRKCASFGVTGTKTAEYCAWHLAGRDGQLQEQKLQNRKLREEGVVRSGRYKGSEVLCVARTGLINRRLPQKVQTQRLRQATVVRSCRYENCWVLCTARTGGDGRRHDQNVQNRRLRQATVVRSCRYKNGRDGHVYNKTCTTESCGIDPSLRVTGTKTAKYCEQNALEGIVTSAEESAKPKAAARFHRSKWQVQNQRSTVHSTHRTK